MTEDFPILQVRLKSEDGGDINVTWAPGDRLAFLVGRVLEKNKRAPVSAKQMLEFARYLKIEPTTEFRFAIQDTILSYSILMLHDWWHARRIRNYYELLIKDPAAAAKQYHGDLFAAALRKELLQRAGIDPLDPATTTAGRERLIAVIHQAHADICELIHAGRSDAKVEQLFLEQIVIIAKKFGADLKLPARIYDRDKKTQGRSPGENFQIGHERETPSRWQPGATEAIYMTSCAHVHRDGSKEEPGYGHIFATDPRI